MSLEAPLVHRARELARIAHADQVRKAGNYPYFTHLENVARILADHGYTDEITQAAAYLHDLVEDQPAHAARMRAEMPEAVVETVHALTEVKHEADGTKRPKRARFEAYVRGLSGEGEAVRRALPISCADKIHNTSSIVESEAAGAGLLLTLGTRPGEHAPQLAQLRALYAPVVAPALLATFDATRDALFATLDAWLPGRAVMIAAGAHLGQRDKGGAPYIEHPLRLMLRADQREAKIVAVLHDVVEDAREWTLERLRLEGFSESVLRALDALTRREAEPYEDFIERVARDRLATRVKLLDLADNLDLSRIPLPTEADHARIARYQRAKARLEGELSLRSLEIVLDDESRAAVRARAVHPIVRGAHVTLAHRARAEALEPAWTGGHPIGAEIELRAVREHQGETVQALVVELAGSTRRAIDGGRLHVTVSRTEGARSRDSNTLLATTEGTPISIPLRGTIAWVDG